MLTVLISSFRNGHIFLKVNETSNYCMPNSSPSVPGSRRPAVRVLALAALLLAVGMAAGGIHWMRAASSDSTTINMLCPSEGQYCGRPVPRLGDRNLQTFLNPAPDTIVAGNYVESVVGKGRWCLKPRDRSCNRVPLRHRVTADDLRSADQALTKEGYPNRVIRLARRDDPAPQGSLLYAVQVGNACIVGHTEYVPMTGQSFSHEIFGQFLNGECLNN